MRSARGKENWTRFEGKYLAANLGVEIIEYFNYGIEMLVEIEEPRAIHFRDASERKFERSAARECAGEGGSRNFNFLARSHTRM